MGHGGVVNGQNLQECLSGGGQPVDYFFQIHEVAYTEVVVASHGKHRNSRSRPLPWSQRIDKAHAADGSNAVLIGCHAEPAVVAALPCYKFSGLVENQELIFRTGLKVFGINIDLPFGEVCIAHGHSLCRIPVAKSRRSATNGQSLAGLNHRSGDTYVQETAFRGQCLAAVLTMTDAIGKGRRIIRFIPRLILPTVANMEILYISATYKAVGITPLFF